MTIADYVYLDSARIDSYFEQTSSEAAVVKLPTYKVGLDMSGPKVELGQQSLERRRGVPEKIERILEYLEKQELLGRGRATSANSSAYAFRLEVCIAERIHIPPARAGAPSDIGINFWLSESPSSTPTTAGPRSGRLYLLESYKANDDFPGGPSSFSGLKALIDYEHRIEDRPTVATLVPGLGAPEIRLLTSDAADFFKKVKAVRSGQRTIRVLYRMRESFLDQDLPPDDDHPQTTVAYPIFIDALPATGR